MAIITVNTGADDTTAGNGLTSLREAIAQAEASAGRDTIVFAAGVSRIELAASGPLVIAGGNDVVIDGDRNNDGIAEVTVDGNTQTSHFTVGAGAIVTLDGLILTAGAQTGANGELVDMGSPGNDGSPAAGSILNAGNLTLSRVILTDNSSVGGPGSDGGGGGIGNGNGSNGGNGGFAGTVVNAAGGVLRLVDTAFNRNIAVGGDGGDGGNGGPGFGTAVGDGGNGGNGGDAAGAILNQGTIVAGGSAAFTTNAAVGGNFGNGGARGEGENGQNGNNGSFGQTDNNVLNAGSGTGTVALADSRIYLAATDLVKAEGNSGATTFTFHINRTGDNTEAASVNWSFVHGSGLDDSDFTFGLPISGTVNFAAGGRNSVAVTLQVVGDTAIEANENFTINLTGITDPAGGVTYGLGTSSVSGTILADDFVSRVFTNAAKTTVVSSQLTKAEFLTALSNLSAGQAIEVQSPAAVGNAGALTINADNVTVFGNAPFDAAFTLDNVVTTFSLGGTANADVTGNVFKNTINGNDGANILDGGSDDDTLNGGAGNDTLSGGFGIDTVNGGAGDDLIRVLNAESGDDTDGGADTDTLDFSAVSNVSVVLSIDGNSYSLLNSNGSIFSGSHTLFNVENVNGSQRGDILRGGGLSSNTIRGNGGNDLIEGRQQADTLFGDAGNDTIFANSEDDPDGSSFGDILSGGTGNDTLNGSSGDDRLNGDADDDTLNGGGGADTLIGGTGNDTMAGGTENDSYNVDAAGDTVAEAAGEGTDTVYASTTWAIGAGQEIEVLRAFYAANATTGITLTGNAGNNSIFGGNKGDTLIGGAGNDRLAGGAGDDKYFVDTKSDTVTETAGGGKDQVIASASYTLRAGVEVETLSTTGGASTIDLVGNEFAQTIFGNNGVNVLNGLGGNDTLSALAGNDSLYGGLGNDRLIGGLGNDGFVFNTALSTATAQNLDTIADFTNASGNNDAIRLAKSVFAALTGNANTLLTKEQFVANAAGAATDTLQHILYETDTGKLFYDADGNKAGGVAAVQFAQLGTTASHPSTITNADFFLI